MKRVLIGLLVILLLVTTVACGTPDSYVLTEDTFFLVMTNIVYYPEQYLGKDIAFDSFTYRLTDVEGKTYTCAVRKCSAGYGCTCGKDTVIGFILDYEGVIPEPKNQGADTVEKTWIHTVGQLANTEKTYISIYAYDSDGNIDYDREPETVYFYTLQVKEMELIQDYSGLAYYVTK